MLVTVSRSNRLISVTSSPVTMAARFRRFSSTGCELPPFGIRLEEGRARLDVRELAGDQPRALGITPKVVAPQDIEGLVRRIRTEHAGDRVLIVNHSLNLPALLRALGHRDPPTIGPDDYDHLFIIVPRGDGPPTVLTLRL